MPAKENCWEATRCGRQPGGIRAHDLGVCPVSTCDEYTGVHDGAKAGRACWVVTGSLCKGSVQGPFSQKFENCMQCEFFNRVKHEEEHSSLGFAATPVGMSIYRKNKDKK
jgi:hypothetical protein